jgi:hypothetical protein
LAAAVAVSALKGAIRSDIILRLSACMYQFGTHIRSFAGVVP